MVCQPDIEEFWFCAEGEFKGPLFRWCENEAVGNSVVYAPADATTDDEGPGDDRA